MEKRGREKQSSLLDRERASRRLNLRRGGAENHQKGDKGELSQG